STHGYDVVDHSKIDAALGGARGFAALSRAFAKAGIGIVVDVVPNHMAIPVPEYQNGALWSVLREGRGSSFAKWFDIDWDAEGDRILMPVLDGPLEENLENLRLVARGGQPELAYFDHRFPIAPGTATLELPELVDAQHYRLADWRSASTQLNYRRFCDITSLIGLRVEDPAVFQASHSVLLDSVSSGRIDGLRIDHPDGLADPAGYLADLARSADAAVDAAPGGASGRGATWVVVEKVLADGEPLPPDWQAAGTTGYETLTVINGLLVDPTGEQPLSRLYTELTGDTADFAQVADAGKRLIARDVLATELARLTRLLGVRANFPTAASAGLQDALIEVFCCLDVYRPFADSALTVAALDNATRTALVRKPALRTEIDAVRAHAVEADEFGIRFGQTAAALYAKGVEDTAFYRHARLLSLNEVGGDPGKFGHSVAEFHRHASTLHSQTPTAMTTLSTHDTKRGEDVRARLAVLSELPREWDRAVRGWLARGDKLGCPDDRTGYFFWQTLVGAWPLDVERAARYMEKATREAKLTTSWQAPDEKYDDAVRAFVSEVFSDSVLLAGVEAFVDVLEPFARTNSLTQKLLQLTMPGVPDTYQGCELAAFTLVDPDNRGAVDFDVRRAAVQTMLDAKLRLTATALRLRRDHRSWFESYQPITPSGPAADHVIAFSRSPSVVVVATRFSARLERNGGWRDTFLALPEGAVAGHTWVDALSGLEHEAGDVPLGELLKNSPVALLVPGVIVT
ncbi:MAG TPA: malto-oligosyltrehalose synthase, partial [Acidothermaceae bacterium]|nr:malto-oligosyltrehalose synthase [Acidothermaceae bacterium]